MRCPKGVRYATEPVVLLYVFGLLLYQTIFSQFIYMKISKEKGFPYEYSGDKSGCGKESHNATLQALQKEVQEMASKLQTLFTICRVAPSVIVCLFLGAWSDRVGRKPVLILSLFGSLLECTVVLLTIYYVRPIWYILIGCFLNGLSGYVTAVIMVVLAYVADTTDINERVVRLALMEAIIFLGGTFSYFSSGYLLTEYDFRNSYWIAFVFLVSSFLYSVFILPESLPKSNRAQGKSCSLAFTQNIWQTLVRPRSQKWKLKLLILSNGFMFFVNYNYGTKSVLSLYLLNYPFCWTSIKIGYFFGSALLISGFGAFFGLKFCKNYLSEHAMILLGLFSLVSFYGILAVANVSWHLYIACAVCVFTGIAAPTFKGLLSKTVEADEQGALFSVVSSLQMLFTLFGQIIFNAFYPVVNKMNAPGLVFVLTIIISYVPIILTLIYKFKMEREVTRSLDVVQCAPNDEDTVTDPFAADANKNMCYNTNDFVSDRGTNYSPLPNLIA